MINYESIAGFDLTANAKAYLSEKADNGACASINDHQRYLSMNIIIYFEMKTCNVKNLF